VSPRAADFARFAVGIATNYGGAWHQVNMAGLPNRYIAGVTVDPTNPARAYAVFNGYSRRFVPGGGVGHVFETTNGGQSWTDISGSLPDIASDALVLSHGKLALGTDLGVFTAAEGKGSATAWSRLGTGLPNAAVDDLTAGPDGYIYAATHGRGVWRITFWAAEGNADRSHRGVNHGPWGGKSDDPNGPWFFTPQPPTSPGARACGPRCASTPSAAWTSSARLIRPCHISLRPGVMWVRPVTQPM